MSVYKSVMCEGTGDAPNRVSEAVDKKPVIPDVIGKGKGQISGAVQFSPKGDFLVIFSTMLTSPQIYSIDQNMHLEGRLYNCNGVLPITMLQNQDVINEYHERAFIKDLFFRLSNTDNLSKHPKYLAEFFMKKTDQDVPQMYGIKDKTTEYFREPNYERLPPIRSHARGIITRHKMDVIDGIQFSKSRAPTTSVWMSPNQGIDLGGNDLYSRVDTPLQADCLDALSRHIFDAVPDKLIGLPSLWGSPTKAPGVTGVTQEDLQTPDVNVPAQPHISSCKKSLKTRCRKLLRRLFGCIFIHRMWNKSITQTMGNMGWWGSCLE